MADTVVLGKEDSFIFTVVVSVMNTTILLQGHCWNIYLFRDTNSSEFNPFFDQDMIFTENVNYSRNGSIH